jgi:hypothetical protein
MLQMPRDKCAEFMRGHTPVFAHSTDPMDAKAWLRIVERKLHTAQCNDCEKVLYGPHLLRGATQSWWESYLATHADPDTITREEFRNNFCQYHIPEGLMIVSESRLEGGELVESENYKLKHTLQAGVSVRNEFESEREGKTNQT